MRAYAQYLYFVDLLEVYYANTPFLTEAGVHRWAVFESLYKHNMI